MRFVLASLVVAILSWSIWPASANAQQLYASQCACTGGAVGKVMHSTNLEEAKALAVKACYKLSDNCTKKPATGVVGETQMFVTTCCYDNEKNFRCHTVPTDYDEDRGRNEAFNKSRQAFYDAGLPNDRCQRVASFSVRTGKRLRD